MSNVEAGDGLIRTEPFFSVWSESLEVYAEWKRLVSAYGVTGVKTHDTRIVAAVNGYNVSRILTFNTKDFIRYRKIEVLHP